MKMKRNFKYFSLSFICLICLACGLLILFTPQLKNIQTDAKTISTTIYLYASGGALKTDLDATKNTLSVTSDGHTYSILGPNASYNVKQGTDGPDPDFDWGHAFINSSSTTNSNSTSGSASSNKDCAVNVYLEGFRETYYDIYADIYADGDFEKKVTIFDSSADDNYSSSKNAQLAVGNWGNVTFKVEFYVSAKQVIAKHYHKYYSPDVGTTTSYIGPVTTEYGKKYRLPATSVKTGYHFQEWRNSNNETLSTFQNNADCVAYSIDPYFYAYCPANEYNLFFEPSGGSIPASSYWEGSGPSAQKIVYYDSKYGTLPTPTRTGYSFVGWYTSGGTYVSSSTKVTTLGNRTVYAHWTANSYTVSLNMQNGTGGTTSVNATYNSAMPSITPPTRNGYIFQGYFSSLNGGGNKYYNTNGTSARNWDKADNTTLYAKWTSITLDQAGGSGGTTMISPKYGNPMPSISVPTWQGHTFNGYYTGQNGGGVKYYNSDGTSARNCDFTSDVTLYAYWTAYVYKVTLNYNGGTYEGSGSRSEDFTYGESKTFPVPTREGYKLIGWKCSYSNIEYKCNDNGSLTITVPYLGANGNGETFTAQWQAKTYTLTANANGGSIPTTSGWSGSGASATKTITFDSTYGTLPTPTRTGHTFAGWYTAASSGVAVSASTGVTTTGARTIYAHWTVNSYTLTADANMTGATFTSVPSGWSGSGTTRTRNVTYNTSYGTLPTPAKEGYIFLGWYTASSGGSSVYSSTTMGAGNTRIYAHWERTWAADATNVELGDLGGSGTIGDPYIIDSELDIAFLALQTSKNVTFDGKYFKQTTNIDLEGKTWLPIGNATTAFQGSYDGNGYLITNITTIANGQLNYSNVGLFGYTRNATIKNVNIISGTIQGYDYVGSIVGNLNNGSIENCRSGATVTGHNYVGMIGYGVSTSILSSYNYGNVSGNDCVGGILGYNDGTGTRLENCYMKGSVTASASNADCGGILGQTSTSGITLQSCGFIGSVTGGSNTGLLTGNLNGGSVIDCFANSTTNYAFTKGSGIVKSSLYIQNKDKDNQVKKYVTHNSETNPFANWTIAVNNQPLPKGFSWISSNGGNLTMEKLEKLGYTA